VNDITTKDDLKSVLGSFWTTYFNDQQVVDGVFQGMSLMSRQLETNIEELRNTVGIQTTPIHHVENWRALDLVQDTATGSFYPLLYDDNAGVYGAPGALPIHNTEFVYGGKTDFRGLETSLCPESVMFITDGFDNPSFVLMNGVDFRVQNNYFVFTDDITTDPRFTALSEDQIYNGKRVFKVWGYRCEFDLLTAARQWGYLLSFESRSSQTYNRALWDLWKARRFGLTPDIFKDLLSTYTGCPRCVTDKEVVLRIIENPDGTHVVITDSNVYDLRADDLPGVEEGQSLDAGQFVGTKICVIETSPMSYIRRSVFELDPNVDLKLLGSDELVETRYVHVSMPDAPSTIVKNGFDNYSPAYARLTTANGPITLRAIATYRHGVGRLTIEVEPTMVIGPQTQTCDLQIFSVTGVPFFSEPYTGAMEAVRCTVQLITDKDDLLKVDPYALTDRVKKVTRVALISMFDDTESGEIKEVLQRLVFTSGDAIAVKVYRSTDFYDDLIGSGTWYGVSRDTILNYDVVLINTASGVVSRLGPEGEILNNPSIDNLEFVQTTVDSLTRRIVELKKHVASRDSDLIWLFNYLNKDVLPSDASWLYDLCGTRGIPDSQTPEGQRFYSYGLFASLDKDKVVFHENNNPKIDYRAVVPDQLWSSSTGYGVSVDRKSVPVYAKRIDVFSRVPRLETELTPGYQYTYKVSGIVVD